MNLVEAKEKCELLAKLNLDIWHAKTSNEQSCLREKFRTTWQAIQSAGFKIIRCRAYGTDGNKIPKFKIREDGSEKYVNIVDNRSLNSYVKGDCTTRCISFCTGVDYDTIQKEQFANARMHQCSWCTCSVWSKSLISRGFCEVVLPKRMSRKVFLKKFESSGIDEGIIATRSSGHLAAIDMKTKKILDTYNSAGGRIKSIYVPTRLKDVWMKKINAIAN